MDHWIDILNEAAKELLENAHDLEKAINQASQNPKALKKHLERICKTLSKVIDQLEKKNSLLRKLVNKLGGTRVSHGRDKLEKYLEDHRKAFEKLRIPPKLIDDIIASLRGEAERGDNALDQPQTLDVNDVIQPLKVLRDLVCEIASDIELALSAPELIEQVVKGVIGAATVVVDVTGAMSAGPHDPTGWVLVKAVKSVWGGVRMVGRATSEIKGMIDRFRKKKGQEHTDEQQRRLRDKAPKNPFKSRKKDDTED